MKKLKKELLFTLFLRSEAAVSDTQFCTFEQLYQLLPYAQSSIRGTVSEFVAHGIVMESLVDSYKAFSLTTFGSQLVRDTFSDLFDVRATQSHFVTVAVWIASYKTKSYLAFEKWMNENSHSKLTHSTWLIHGKLTGGQREGFARFFNVCLIEHGVITKSIQDDLATVAGKNIFPSRIVDQKLTQLSNMINAGLKRPQFAIKIYRELISEFTAYPLDNSRIPGISDEYAKNKKLLFIRFQQILSTEFFQLLLQSK